MTRNGRGIVIVVALTLIFSAAGFALVSAQNSGSNVKLTQNAEGEYVTIHNNGDQPFDLSGKTLSFDDGQTNYTFDDGVEIGSGETVTVGTGAHTSMDTDYSAEYDGYVLNNTSPDTVRLLDGDTVIASTDDETDTTTATDTVTTTTTPTSTTTTFATTTITEETTTDETTTTSGTTTTTDQTATTSDETTTTTDGMTTTYTTTTTSKDC
ncbi:lamin tail domain-containing protein [Haladaptatus sp. AB618]|uniref:lamin tail domain-containing protein n=1 Tax=Haladaptatus sp. AB618 TaxID=2934173 RepID=UPI00209C61B4|nr:lamin tail domain-containing protein [Haladaptatus sp. AB618]MCO8256141.1 lamin tail domain-containing protein [Haladaptatus sp. AB618]